MQYQRREQKHIPEVQAGSKGEKFSDIFMAERYCICWCPWQQPQCQTITSCEVAIPFPWQHSCLLTGTVRIQLPDEAWELPWVSDMLFRGVGTYHKCMSSKRHIRALYIQGAMERHIWDQHHAKPNACWSWPCWAVRWLKESCHSP